MDVGRDVFENKVGMITSRKKIITIELIAERYKRAVHKIELLSSIRTRRRYFLIILQFWAVKEGKSPSRVSIGSE